MTLFPDKVPVWGTGARTSTYLLKGYSSTQNNEHPCFLLSIRIHHLFELPGFLLYTPYHKTFTNIPPSGNSSMGYSICYLTSLFHNPLTFLIESFLHIIHFPASHNVSHSTYHTCKFIVCTWVLSSHLSFTLSSLVDRSHVSFAISCIPSTSHSSWNSWMKTAFIFLQ